MLVRLLYASKARDAITDELLASILAQSRKNNPQTGVTGVLCVCHGGVFLQLLEGGRDEVNHLYSKVLRDDRHTVVTLLEYAEITERRFSGWRMGRVDLDKINASIVLKYSEKPQIDPFGMSGSAALKLFEELASGASIMGGS
ncbi:MAG: BLUF domain-containing protein [Phycisphaerales bacterium]|nr:BLUF domain-containing protein [Phycisphaerales bacterium]